MALRLGIGDTLTLCKGAIDYCSRTAHDEPEDARTLIADMCLMRSHLQALSRQVGEDEKAFAASRPDITNSENRAPVIQRSLAPIQKDLWEMRQALHERDGASTTSRRKPSLHIVDQVRRHVLYRAKLESLRGKMPAHGRSVSEMGTLVDAQTHRDRRASVARLGTLAEEREREEEDAALEEGRRCRGELLGLLEQHVDRAGGEEGDDGDDGKGMEMREVLGVLKEGLVAKGYEEGRVEEQMSEIRGALARGDGDGDGIKGPEALQLERFKF